MHRHNRGRSPRTIQSRRTTVPIGTVHTHLMLYLSAQRYVSDQYPRTASADMPLQCLRHYDYTDAVSLTLLLYSYSVFDTMVILMQSLRHYDIDLAAQT